MNDSMSKIVYTKEQSDILEITYGVMYDELRKVVSLVNITQAGLFNIHGEFNKNIEPLDMDCILKTLQDLLNPIVTEICEASCNADYFLWAKEEKNKYDFWRVVDKQLNVVQKKRKIDGDVA